MALNLATLKTRTLTAIVYAVVMMGGLCLNQWSFLILFSLVHFGCWVEYQRLVEKIDPGYKTITKFHKYGVILAGWCLMLFASGDNFTLGSLPLPALGLWLGLLFLFVLPLAELLLSKEIVLKNIAYSVLGLIYISLCWALWMDLRRRGVLHLEREHSDVNFQVLLPLAVVVSIWMNDSMAYFVGSLIGKTPLSKVSPKKTWEGTIGGILLTMGLVYWLASTLEIAKIYAVTDWLVIGFLSAVVGTIGDLLESKLKRMADVKDSGHFMPGHGGFLDRFDSLLLAIPIVWIYVALFMH